MVEIDATFGKFTIPVDDDPDNPQEITHVLHNIGDKTSFAARKETGRLRITIKINLSSSSNLSKLSLPVIFENWMENVRKIEFSYPYDVKESLSSLMNNFPNIEALILKNVNQNTYKHLCNIKNENLEQLSVNMDFFKDTVLLDNRIKKDFCLPKLKYLSLNGKNNLLYEAILNKYDSQLEGLEYIVNDEINYYDDDESSTYSRQFYNLQFLNFHGVKKTNWTLPNLQFLILPFNCLLNTNVPNMKYLVAPNDVNFINEIIRKNKRKSLEILILNGNELDNQICVER